MIPRACECKCSSIFLLRGYVSMCVYVCGVCILQHAGACMLYVCNCEWLDARLGRGGRLRVYKTSSTALGKRKKKKEEKRREKKMQMCQRRENMRANISFIWELEM